MTETPDRRAAERATAVERAREMIGRIDDADWDWAVSRAKPRIRGEVSLAVWLREISHQVKAVRALLSDVPAGGEPLVRVYRDGELLSQLRATPPGAGVAGVGYTVEVVPADTEGAGPDHVGEPPVPFTFENHVQMVADGTASVDGFLMMWRDRLAEPTGDEREALKQPTKRLRRFIRRRRATGETCYALSFDECLCPLCDLDRILSALSSKGERITQDLYGPHLRERRSGERRKPGSPLLVGRLGGKARSGTDRRANETEESDE